MIKYGYLFHLDDPRLTDEQRKHVEEIAREFTLTMAEKYARGQQEHGGNLWDLSLSELIDAAIFEAIDQVVYLSTIRQKLRQMEKDK